MCFSLEAVILYILVTIGVVGLIMVTALKSIQLNGCIDAKRVEAVSSEARMMQEMHQKLEHLDARLEVLEAKTCEWDRKRG